jgi:hypothetical protein
MKRRLILITLILSGLILGFVQENWKVGVNFVLEQSEAVPGYWNLPPEERSAAVEARRIFSPLDYYYSHDTPRFLFSMERSELNALKWGITGGMILIFLMINSSVAFLMTNDRKAIKWMATGYVFVFITALLIYLAGYAAGDLSATYGVSRKLAGGLQSLIPIMLFTPAWYLNKQRNISSPR